MEKYCDIIPDATGWTYVIDGVRAESCYHTYDLAVHAARSGLMLQGEGRKNILRRQALNGDMQPVDSAFLPADSGRQRHD